jgi:formylglycine-generating enzyme required for sulfatase activity
MKEKYGYCQDLDEIAWYLGNSGKKPHPVGQKKPNNWGFYDMLGNVWEHTSTSDCFFYEEPEIDPNYYYSGWGRSFHDRIIRGGSYCDEPWCCRSAMRMVFSDLGKQKRNHGARLALVYQKANF